MKIWKIAEKRLYEGDRIRAYFRGNWYNGTIDYYDEEQNDYLIKFDNYEDLNQKAETNSKLFDLLNWMEGNFNIKDLQLIQTGMRWEEIKSDLDLVHSETFSLYGNAWDVREAKRIIYKNPRSIESFPVKSVKYYVEMGLIAIGKYKNADLGIPLILISTKGDDKSGQFPIDGWHRIKRALEEGIEELPCYILTEEESKKIKSKYL